MKMMTFALRNTKEILRDKLTLFFGLGFPIILLLMMTLMQSNLPVDIFNLDSLTPGMVVFGLSFISLFSATVISKDRSGSLILRLYTSPMSPTDYIFGYTLPLLPMALAQAAICYGVAVILGLKISSGIALALITVIPSSLVFIALGLLCGSIFNDKQVGGICGALLTNVSVWLSGTWFSLDLLGPVFKKIANCLPFCHAVEAGRIALSGNFGGALIHIAWVLGYAIVLFAAAALVFTRKMHSDNI